METVMLILAGTLVSVMIVFGIARQSKSPRPRAAGNSDGGAAYVSTGDGCDAGDAGCDGGGGDGGGGGGD